VIVDNKHAHSDDLSPAMGHVFKERVPGFAGFDLMCNRADCHVTWNGQREEPRACRGGVYGQPVGKERVPGPAQDMFVYREWVRMNGGGPARYVESVSVPDIGVRIGLDRRDSIRAVSRAKALIKRVDRRRKKLMMGMD